MCSSCSPFQMCCKGFRNQFDLLASCRWARAARSEWNGAERIGNTRGMPGNCWSRGAEVNRTAARSQSICNDNTVAYSRLVYLAFDSFRFCQLPRFALLLHAHMHTHTHTCLHTCTHALQHFGCCCLISLLGLFVSLSVRPSVRPFFRPSVRQSSCLAARSCSSG